MKLNPKQRFNKNKTAADFHAGLVDKDEFQAALEAALCEMELEMPAVVNPAQDVTTASQMNGARKFINVFLNLTNNEKFQPQKDPTDLVDTEHTKPLKK